MKKRFLNWWNRDKPMRIVITFIRVGERIETDVKMSKEIPVSYAITTLERLTWKIKAGLTNKAKINGLDSNNPKTRAFIKGQTINDVQ